MSLLYKKMLQMIDNESFSHIIKWLNKRMRIELSVYL